MPHPEPLDGLLSIMIPPPNDGELPPHVHQPGKVMRREDDALPPLPELVVSVEESLASLVDQINVPDTKKGET